MQKGFFSIVLFVIFAASLLVLSQYSHSTEESASHALLSSLKLEKDYYLRAALRHGIVDSLSTGGSERLSEFAEFASSHYPGEEISIQFWCAQSSERNLPGARKWKFGELTTGVCEGADYARPDSAEACGLFLSTDPLTGETSITGFKGIRHNSGGELCVYPELISTEPSVFGATISYPDGNWSIAAVPQQEAVSYGTGTGFA